MNSMVLGAIGRGVACTSVETLGAVEPSTGRKDGQSETFEA